MLSSYLLSNPSTSIQARDGDHRYAYETLQVPDLIDYEVNHKRELVSKWGLGGGGPVGTSMKLVSNCDEMTGDSESQKNSTCLPACRSVNRIREELWIWLTEVESDKKVT